MIRRRKYLVFLPERVHTNSMNTPSLNMRGSIGILILILVVASIGGFALFEWRGTVTQEPITTNPIVTEPIVNNPRPTPIDEPRQPIVDKPLSDREQFTGIVYTGASQGQVKKHCSTGLYLALDPGSKMNAQQTLLLLRDAKGEMITDQSYVGKRVTITGTYPDENAMRCEALICGCEEYLLADTIAVQ